MEKIKIAVIDDEKDICALVQEVLENTGAYTVVTANDGDSGAQLCFAERPRLIFLDFVMPKVKGDQVIAALKSRPETKGIPIVLMSGLGEMIYIHQGKGQWKWAPRTEIVRNRGELPEALKWKTFSEELAKKMSVKAYLQKPFAKDSLLSVTREILETETPETGIFSADII